MTVSPLRVLKKFSGPLGYVPDEDTDVVEGGKAAKKFLNFLLSKLQTTVTVLTTTDCRHQMFFTTRKQWFVAEEFFVPENGSLYVDAVLANIFLDNLTEFIGDTGHVKEVLASQPEKLNILADHIATVLQPFLQPDSTGNLALVKTIWAFYRPICEEAIELQIEERDVIMDLRPAWDYVAVPEQQQAVTVRLFDSGDFRWPSKFVKLPISSSSINSSPYIPMHIKHFLSAFSSRLGQNFSIERQESPARTEFSHRHREQIVLSIYNWNWIAACSLYLQLSDNPDERRRELHLFEADLAIQMYTSLVEKTFCPADLVKKLELVEKSTVTVIAEAVVRFLEKHRDFEFKFEAKAWESREWKKLAEQFWKEGEAEERNNNQMETETSFDRIPADSELLVKQEPSLSPPESMSENDEDSQKSEPIEEELCNLTTSFYQEQNKHEFDILSMEDSIECRLSMTEVESDGFRGLESHRQFLNLILAKLGAELVLKADTRSSFDEDKITIEIRKDDDLMYQADLRTYVPERLLEQGIQSLVKSFEQRMLISPADAKSLQSGGEATKEMIAAIVEECDGSRM